MRSANVPHTLAERLADAEMIAGTEPASLVPGAKRQKSTEATDRTPLGVRVGWMVRNGGRDGFEVCPAKKR